MGLSNSSIKVSAIIPVYNEEKTVAGVIKTLLASKMIDEIIGINDGSTDRSLRILKGFGKKIILIDYKRNRGKGFALAQGIKKAKGEIVAFFDADLVNLSEVHIEKLVSPLLKKEATVALG
jgi:glycosyltransferase involved in cell wall biosynthesis